MKKLEETATKQKNIFKPVAHWKRFIWKKNSKQQHKERKKKEDKQQKSHGSTKEKNKGRC